MTERLDDNMPNKIWVVPCDKDSGEYDVNKICQCLDCQTCRTSQQYVHTDLYTAACAERDALRELCEGMVEKINSLKMYTSEIESVHPAYAGEYGEWVKTDDVLEILAAYEKHKAGE